MRTYAGNHTPEIQRHSGVLARTHGFGFYDLLAGL
jgi:hypothetical protein